MLQPSKSTSPAVPLALLTNWPMSSSTRTVLPKTYILQGRPGSARNRARGDLWHGAARKILAWKNIGTTWQPGNPEIWSPTNEKKHLKNQIRSAQNVGKVWDSRNKILLTLFGAI